MFYWAKNKYVAGIVLSALLLGFGFFICVFLSMNMQSTPMNGMNMDTSSISCIPSGAMTCFFSASLTQMMHWQDTAVTSESLLIFSLFSLAIVSLVLRYTQFLLLIDDGDKERIRKRKDIIVCSLTKLFSQGILNSRLFV